MIRIIPTNKQPKENEDLWSFSIEDIEYVLSEHSGDFYYYKGRLYEKGE